MEKGWHKKFVKLVGVNNWAPEWYPRSIRNFNAQDVACIVANSGADAGFTFQGFSQDHFGVNFFPTELGHRHVGLQSGRDHIREYGDALHKLGRAFFAYYCFQDRILWDKNPDWRQRNEQGEARLHDAFGGLCPNSPYREHFISRMLEITANYDIDGWLLDMLQYDSGELSCYCPYCERKYRERYGVALPKGTPEYSPDFRQFLRWRQDTLSGLLEELASRIREIKPDIIFTHNAFALRSGRDYLQGVDYERHFAVDDVVTDIVDWGTGDADRRVSRYTDMIWQAGFFTRVFKGLSDKPVWMQMGRFTYNREYQAQPVHELTLSAGSVAINGGCPFFIDNIFPDGTVDPVASERLAQAYGSLSKIEQYLDSDGELEFAGVFFSAKSQERSDLIHPGRYLDGIRGTCKALVEGHIPYQVFGERTFQKLTRYKVVILPGATVMSDAMAQSIRDYVRGGGAIVALGDVSLVDETGAVRENFALADVFAADFCGYMNYSRTFLKPTEHEITRGIDRRLHIPLREFFPVSVKARPGAAVAAELEPAATEFSPEVRIFTYADDVPPAGMLFEPGLVASKFGKGKCCYSGADITRVYGVYGYPELREVFLNCVAWCAEPPFTTDAPLCVETACRTQGSRVIVHFLNYATTQLRSNHHVGGGMAEQELPVHCVTFRLSGLASAPLSAKLASGEPLPFAYEGGAVTCTVPEIRTLEFVILEMEPEKK